MSASRRRPRLVQRLEAREVAGELGSALSDEAAEAPGRAAAPRPERRADGDPRRRRQRNREDDHDRQARAEAPRARLLIILLAAADAFRAAAEGNSRSGPTVPARTSSDRSAGDPAAVAYDAIEAATARGYDVVIVDTAGRLHTQTNLMEGLAKVRRVIGGALPGARRTRHCSSSMPPRAGTASSRRDSSAKPWM